MIKLTSGDMMHVYGSFGLKKNYTVRLTVRLTEAVEGALLEKALESTAKRYPYLLLKMMRDEKEIYYVENPLPVRMFEQTGPVTLGARETNYHMWAVCCHDDTIFLDFYHGLCDGAGMYMVLSTLLYYYLAAKHGQIDSDGIRTLEDEIEPEEYADPQESLPLIGMDKLPAPSLDEPFLLIRDGGFTPSEEKLFDIAMPEKDFVRFSSANDASPGVMVSLLLARAVDRVFPERDRNIIASYVINARPMLGAMKTHHNCVTTSFLDYSDKIRKMPFDRQCTAYRGKVFVQSDADRIKGAMTVMSSRVKGINGMLPAVEGKMDAYARMLAGGDTIFTYMVSYVGKWKYPSVGRYIREFWTHVPCACGVLTEIAAVNGTIFLTVHQSFAEDALIKAFEEELKANGISYILMEKKSDVARMSMPDKG